MFDMRLDMEIGQMSYPLGPRRATGEKVSGTTVLTPALSSEERGKRSLRF
jgi:hypothetical protein